MTMLEREPARQCSVEGISEPQHSARYVICMEEVYGDCR
jgi:hypothetical protein